jgi:hypothetical protein
MNLIIFSNQKIIKYQYFLQKLHNLTESDQISQLIYLTNNAYFYIIQNKLMKLKQMLNSSYQSY